MATPSLGRGAKTIVNAAIDRVFDKLTARYVGPKVAQRGDTAIHTKYRPDLTVQSLYEAAAREENTKGDPSTVDSLVEMILGYLAIQRQSAKNKILHAVESTLRSGDTANDLESALGGQLNSIWKTTTSAVERVLDSEATKARNFGVMEGVSKVAASFGVEDPVMYFVVVRDGERCDECTRLHLMPDKITPRLWRMSQIGHNYHKKGDDSPCWAGLHPHCRCSVSMLMPGYGFDKAGNVIYVSAGYSAINFQQK